ncbi:MAG: hypothetical protein IKS15_01190 [Opitutales bacterium]|nr:hypothetical protein [Opitutales bacterium]
MITNNNRNANIEPIVIKNIREIFVSLVGSIFFLVIGLYFFLGGLFEACGWWGIFFGLMVTGAFVLARFVEGTLSKVSLFTGISFSIYLIYAHTEIVIFAFIAIGAFVVSFLCFYLFKMFKKGVVIDVANDRIGIPGFGKSVNSWQDFLHTFKYIEIPISAIESISTDESVSVDEKNGNVTHYYYINISGSSIGSYCISLDDKGKQQQIWTILANANKMGVPVLNR